MPDLSQKEISVLEHSGYAKLLLGCTKSKWGLISFLGVWILSGGALKAETQKSLLMPENGQPQQVMAALKAETQESISAPMLENGQPQQDTAVLKLENRSPEANTNIEEASSSLNYPLSVPILVAGPENFNPDLRFSPPTPPLPPPSPPPKLNPPTESREPTKPTAVLESLQTDFRNDRDNFGQQNQFIEETARFRLSNGDRLRVKTGFNSFDRTGFDRVTNIPLQIGWEGKIGNFPLQIGGGVDIFNRLPTAINFNSKIDVPIARNVTLSGVVEQAPYKFNAQTLENQITAWRYGTNLFWQIDRYTSLFSLFRLGNYNDGNTERQSFTRLERKFGQFSIAANLFTWNYDRDVQNEKGYFSPPDFLVYNGELAWESQLFNALRCRLSANLGQQQLFGKTDPGNNYQARCTFKFLPNVEADFGYEFSNLRNRNTGASSYNNRSFTGQLRMKF